MQNYLICYQIVIRFWKQTRRRPQAIRLSGRESRAVSSFLAMLSRARNSFSCHTYENRVGRITAVFLASNL